MMKVDLKPSAWSLTFLILSIIFILGFGPLLVILALNTLFGLNIEFNLTTWSSVIILHAFFHSAVSLK